MIKSVQTKSTPTQTRWILAHSFPAGRTHAHTRSMRDRARLRYASMRHLRTLPSSLCDSSTHNLTQHIAQYAPYTKIRSTQFYPHRIQSTRFCSRVRFYSNKPYAKNRASNSHPAQHKPHTLTLGIGANLGTKAQICKRFFHALAHFSRNPHCEILVTSPIYYNPPFGYTNQPHFYNAIITLATSLNILEVFRLVFYIERRFGRGRKRAFKNAPRTLDIDIIFYDKVIIKRAYLTIPHTQWHKRDSILLPLSFIGITRI